MHYEYKYSFQITDLLKKREAAKHTKYRSTIIRNHSMASKLNIIDERNKRCL